MDFIMNNFDTVIELILSLVLAIFAATKGKWMVVRYYAYKFMFSAERLMATEEGKARMDAVYAAVWQKIPKWLKRFVTEETLREKLQKWYNLAKNSLGGDTDGLEATSNT